MAASAKLEHVALHVLRIAFQPPFRSEHFRIGAEDLLTPVQNPSINSDCGASWEFLPAYLGSLGWHQTGDVQSHCRPNAHSFFEARLEVGQCLCLVPLREVAQASGSCCVVYLVPESFTD